MDAKIFLPWPSKTLSPNGSHRHWSVISKARKKAKQDAYFLALEAGLHKIDASKVGVKLTFYPPSRRRFDADNLLFQHKAALDGIAQALGVDDNIFEITFGLAGVIEKNGLVKIDLTW